MDELYTDCMPSAILYLYYFFQFSWFWLGLIFPGDHALGLFKRNLLNILTALHL